MRRAEGLGKYGNDDFASMREVVERRYSRLQTEGKPFPSLVLIDGGIGQLHAAATALEGIGASSQPVAAIAKKEELIYLLGQESEPIRLDRFSPLLRMIQQIRDEAHRFAVTFHRQRSKASRIQSELTGIPGIGEKTSQALLRSFGSVKRVRLASEEELRSVISASQAASVRQYFAPSE